MKRSTLLGALGIVAAMQTIALPSYAMPFTDIRIEDLMHSEGDLKKSLHLNSNQQLLWEQTQAKARTLLRTRQARREQLQGTLKLALVNSNADLRDIATKIDADAEQGLKEERQLRELWLTVNDALDDAQRQMVLQFLADQLDRMPGPDREKDGNRSKGDVRGGPGGRMGGGMGGSMGGGMGRP